MISRRKLAQNAPQSQPEQPQSITFLILPVIFMILPVIFMVLPVIFKQKKKQSLKPKP